MLAVTTTQAYAMDVSFDRDTQTITVSGTAVENERLAIIITDSEVSNLYGVTESFMETHGIGFYEADADGDGEYSVSFKMDNEDGLYRVFVSGKDTKENAQVEVYTDVAQGCLNKFNAMVNKVQVKDLVEDLKEVYGGDEDIYDKYFGLKSTDSIDKIVYKGKPYNSLSDVYDVFAKAVEEYEPPKGGSGVGGSGGSSSGGSGITIIPSVITPKEEEASTPVTVAQSFADVSPEYWGYEAIEGLYKKGIVSGVNDNEFAPDKTITREEFITMLVSLTGLEVNGGRDTFADTDKNAWYSPYLAIAQECGLAFGKEDGSFGVGEVLTRQDMAVLAARVLGTTQRNEVAEFTDAAEIAGYAKNSVEILCGLKVMNGVGDGSFAPRGTATRAQAAKVIYEISKIIR